MSGRKCWIGLVAAAILVANPSSALACPGCIEGSSAGVAAGFFWSVMFMMAVPFFVVGTVGGGLYFAYRRSVHREVEALLEATREESLGSP